MNQQPKDGTNEHAVETKNRAKVLYPDSDISKGDIIDYYAHIADEILPHLQQRPLVVERYPDGVYEHGFFQKQASHHLPDWIATADVEVKTKGQRQELVVCNDKATLIYLANQACITLHPWLSRRDKLNYPDTLIIDLDPPDEDFEAVRSGALKVRDLFELLKLPCFVNLTGSRGVHLRVPIEPAANFDQVRSFATSAMAWLANRYPDELTMEQRKQERNGRLYLDVGRNVYAQTAVAPWSLRPLPKAPIAVPIPWRALEEGKLRAQEYALENVRSHLERRSDPWAMYDKARVSLDEPKARLDRLWHDPS